MMKKYYIGIDIGTSGTKVMLTDVLGKKLASHTEEYPLYQPKNGWAEQDPADWWRAVREGIRAVTAEIDANEIGGIGLSGQMHGLVMLDKNGNVLRRSIIWCDQRTAEECAEITRLVGADRLMDITLAPALTGFTASKILWVRNHEPEVFDKCVTILLPKDYIRFMLTGEKATEVSDASGMQLLDIAERDWSDEVLSALSLDKSLLGKVYESSEVTGTVTGAAAEACGIAAGIPVVGGAGDNAASAVGCGVVTAGKAFTTIGTSGVVFAHTPALCRDPKGRIHSFCSAVKGEWHVMGVTQAAGLSLKWFRDNFCDTEKAQASAAGVDPYQIMDGEAAEVPIGSDRLLYLPYLMGERTPHLDPFARGAFLGLSAKHTKADMLRAVMEGVTFSLRDCLTIFGESGIRADSMMACGGGASSPLWRQMLADVFGCTVITPQSNDGGALGAALLAATGAGAYRDVPEACAAAIRTKTEQKPDPAHTAEYEKYYRIYRDAYAAIRPVVHGLCEL